MRAGSLALEEDDEKKDRCTLNDAKYSRGPFEGSAHPTKIRQLLVSLPRYSRRRRRGARAMSNPSEEALPRGLGGAMVEQQQVQQVSELPRCEVSLSC